MIPSEIEYFFLCDGIKWVLLSSVWCKICSMFRGSGIFIRKPSLIWRWCQYCSLTNIFLCSIIDDHNNVQRFWKRFREDRGKRRFINLFKFLTGKFNSSKQQIAHRHIDMYFSVFLLNVIDWPLCRKVCLDHI